MPTITIKNTGWTKVEDVIKEQIQDDFTFKEGVTYLFQLQKPSFSRVVSAKGSPNENEQGFIIREFEMFSYTHAEEKTMYLLGTTVDTVISFSD